MYLNAVSHFFYYCFKCFLSHKANTVSHNEWSVQVEILQEPVSRSCQADTRIRCPLRIGAAAASEIRGRIERDVPKSWGRRPLGSNHVHWWTKVCHWWSFHKASTVPHRCLWDDPTLVQRWGRVWRSDLVLRRRSEECVSIWAELLEMLGDLEQRLQQFLKAEQKGRLFQLSHIVPIGEDGHHQLTHYCRQERDQQSNTNVETIAWGLWVSSCNPPASLVSSHRPLYSQSCGFPLGSWCPTNTIFFCRLIPFCGGPDWIINPSSKIKSDI